MIIKVKYLPPMVLFILYEIVSALSVMTNMIPSYSKVILWSVLLISGIFLLVFANKYFSISQDDGVKKFYSELLCLCVVMTLSTMINLLVGTHGYELGNAVVDIAAISVLFVGLYYINYVDNSVMLTKMIFFVGTIACIIGFIAILNSNFRIQNIDERATNTLGIQYYLWKLMECWPLLILHTIYNFKKGKWFAFRFFITLTCFLGYVVLCFLFMKRIIFFDIIVLLLVLIISFRFRVGKITKVLALSLLAVAVLYYVITEMIGIDLNKIFQLTIGRVGDGSEFDRLDEFKDLFSEFGSGFVFFGMGFGSSHSRAGGVNLHLGVLNFVFKGGLFFFLLMLSSGYKALKVLSSNIDQSNKIYSSFVLYTFLRSFASPFWVPNPTRIFFSICLAMTLYQYSRRKLVKIET